MVARGQGVARRGRSAKFPGQDGGGGSSACQDPETSDWDESLLGEVGTDFRLQSNGERYQMLIKSKTISGQNLVNRQFGKFSSNGSQGSSKFTSKQVIENEQNLYYIFKKVYLTY